MMSEGVGILTKRVRDKDFFVLRGIGSASVVEAQGGW
jgi:hypothetical protein